MREWGNLSPSHTLSRRKALIGGIAAFGTSTLGYGLSWAEDEGDVANSPNVVRGIEATYDMKVLSTGEVFGHEHWSLYVHPDGSRTVSARLINNDFNLFRTVIHRVDANFRPLECQLLYYRDGQRMGSAWFQFGKDHLKAEANLPSGNVTQEVAIPEQLSMVNHSAAAEGWHFWYCPKDGNPHTATLYNLHVNAKTPVGVLGRVHTRTIQHLKEETIDTPAGSFDCDYYAFGDPSRIWVHGEDQMPVRLRFAEMDREFVVSRWEVMT